MIETFIFLPPERMPHQYHLHSLFIHEEMQKWEEETESMELLEKEKKTHKKQILPKKPLVVTQ